MSIDWSKIKRCQEHDEYFAIEDSCWFCRAEDALKEVDALRDKLATATEALQEIAIPPYPDSDLASYVEQISAYAAATLTKIKENV